MKKIGLLLLLLTPVVLYAGVIVKKNGERLEDVTIKSSSGNEFVYIDDNGVEGSVPRSEVAAVLYDDGRYEEIKQDNKPLSSSGITNQEAQVNAVQNVAVIPVSGDYTPAPLEEGAKAYNVYAYGVYAGMGYFSKEETDDITVEYRVIYKSKKEEPAFVYLGTTPFAYVTDQMAQNSFVGRGNPRLMELMQPQALVIPNDKNVKAIEFRLSKPGYKTIVVKPFKDVIIGCGPLLMISLDRLKPLKEGETNEVPAVATVAISAQGAQNAISAPNEESSAAPSEEDAVAATAIVAPVMAVASQETDTPKKSSKKKEPMAPDYSEYQDGQIHKLSSNQFYFEDRTYTKKEIKSVVLDNCPEAEQYYKNAKKWVNGGWSCVAVSTAMIVVGSILLPIGAYNEVQGSSHWVDTYSYTDEYGNYVTVYGHREYDKGPNSGVGMSIAGGCLLGVGCAGFVTSFVIACVGHSRMNNSYKIFNSSCANKKEPALSLNFGPTRNGIGMTLKF